MAWLILIQFAFIGDKTTAFFFLIRTIPFPHKPFGT
jgi:hypothetical protein